MILRRGRKGRVMSRKSGSRIVNRGASGRAPLRVVASNGAPVPAAAPVKAAPLALPRGASFGEAVALALGSCLDHFSANWPAFRETGAPESVHQMRVALRRLRAAVGLFKRAAPSPELEAAASRAKEIAAVLGAARDWDVFRDMLEGGPREFLRDEPGFYALLDAVELRRGEAYRKARATIEAVETSQFVANLRVELRRNLGGGRAGAARDFARRALDRLHRRVVKKSRDLASRTPDERHAARIALKKARYGAEFFQSLFETSARDYVRALATLQDSLGADNDMEMATRLLDRIDAEEGGKSMRASAFTRGWFAQAQRQGAARASKSEKTLRKLEPFWR